MLEDVERSVSSLRVGLLSKTERAQRPLEGQHRQHEKKIIMIGPKIMPDQGAGEPPHQPYVIALLLVGWTVG